MLIILLSVLIFTFLRTLLLPTLPVFLIFVGYLFGLKLTKQVLLFVSISLFIIIIGCFVNETYFLNLATSFLICFLPAVFLLLKPTKQPFTTGQWFSVSAIILAIVDVSAFIDFIYVMISKTRLLDDGFIGIYGTSGLNMHTLCIINFVYAVYFFGVQKIWRAVMFMFAGFMCFYGLGLLLFILAFGICLLTTLNIKYLKYILVSPLIALLLVLLISILNPKVFSYMSNNITNAVSAISSISYEEQLNRIKEFKRVETPRKVLSFVGGYERVLKNPSIVIFGTTPGTYNSRTSFLLNGEYAGSQLTRLIANRPVFASEDIYPLWNKKITYRYNDGTRNQPFSSVLSLTMEYGVIISTAFFVMLAISFKRFQRQNEKLKLFGRFLFLYLVFNLMVENYLEYPELMLLVIIIAKTRANDGKISKKG